MNVDSYRLLFYLNVRCAPKPKITRGSYYPAILGQSTLLDLEAATVDK